MPNPVGSNQKPHITGRQCRDIFFKKFTKSPMQFVEGFSSQAFRSNSVLLPPPKIKVFAPRPKKSTLFSVLYRRHDIPVALWGNILQQKLDSSNMPLKWFCDPKHLNYCFYLPIFLDGLADSNPSYRLLTKLATMDMIMKHPDQVLPILGRCVPPLRRALQTRDPQVISDTLKIIQLMVLTTPCLGLALVPFYRHLLPICNLFKNSNVNLRCNFDYQPQPRLGDIIDETLVILERCGGPLAYINIKYMIPTYESRVYPKCKDSAPSPCARPGHLIQALQQVGGGTS